MCLLPKLIDLVADIQALAGGDKPRPYKEIPNYKVAAGFIPAH